MNTAKTLPAIRSLLAASAVAAIVAGCGGSGGRAAGASTGREVFAQACSGCHTIDGVNDPRHQGGDLLALRATSAQLMQFASEMPVPRRLSDGQLRAVVDYLMEVQRRGR